MLALASIGSLILYLTYKHIVETIEDTTDNIPIPYMVVSSSNNVLDQQSVNCLILNGYYEARNQPEEAIIAVAQVALNRWNDSRYPDTVCDVIQQSKYDSQGRIILHQCQFSWYCDGKSDRPKEELALRRISSITEKAIIMWYANIDITNGATHYHANYVNPDWSTQLAYIKHIGDHIFYKWN